MSGGLASRCDGGRVTLPTTDNEVTSVLGQERWFTVGSGFTVVRSPKTK